MSPRFRLAILSILLGLAPLGAAPPDVFTALQQNTWYLPTRDKAARLLVTEVGQGQPLVFLHGGPGNDFQYAVDAFRPHLAGNRIIFFDQRGSLLSPVAQGGAGALAFDKLVEDLDQLREALGVERLRIFGHSFGSLLAMGYVRRYPDRVASLILCGALPPDLAGGLAGWVREMRPRQEALRRRPEAIAAVLKAEGLGTDPAADTPRQASMRWRIANQAPICIVDLRRWRQVTGGRVYYNEAVSEAIGDSLPADLAFGGSFRASAFPVTVLQGDRDYVSPGAPEWAELARSRPGIRVVVLPRSSHYPWIDAPRAFHAALKAALAQGAPQASSPR